MASAAILAGGRARRFDGRDKTALIVDGRTILERQIDVLQQVSSDIMLVRAVNERPADAGRRDAPGVEGAVTGSGPTARLRLVHDRMSDCGPLGGLDAALASAREDLVLILAGDMPFVTVPFLKGLIALAGDDIDAVVPRTERGYHPLCAVYHRRCRAAVARRLDERALKLTDLLDDLRVRAVDDLARFGPSERLLANVNTPADLDRVEALLGHEP
jgi:molybdopterin-guanine dinucleotide biosynthesis protein A